MKILGFITRQRNNYSSELSNDMRYWSLSAMTLSYFMEITPIVKHYVRGVTLDAGAGRLNGKMLIDGYCSEYVAMDVDNFNGMIQIISDVQAMTMVKDNAFDTVYSSQVLEHVPRPWDALSEIYRILRPGGHAIISVPLLNGLHEEPHDYYRYTPYGLRYLMEQAGFTIKCETTAGGLLSFLSHIISLMVICLFWQVPLIRWVAWYINKILIVHPIIWLEYLIGIKRKFPACIIMVGEKMSDE